MTDRTDIEKHVEAMARWWTERMKGPFTTDQKAKFQKALANEILDYAKRLNPQSVLTLVVAIEYYASPFHVKASLDSGVPINDRQTFPSKSLTFIQNDVSYGQVGMVRERLHPPEEF